MTIDRLARVNELLRREISEQLARLMSGGDVNPARLTITRVRVSPNLRTARVYVSIMADGEDCTIAMNAVKRHRKELQRHVAQDLHIKYTPRLVFEQDSSIAEGDEVLRMLSELDTNEDHS